MEQTENHTEQTVAEKTVARSQPSDLLYLIRAYNRREMSFEQWLELSRQWAEAIIQRFTPEQKP